MDDIQATIRGTKLKYQANRTAERWGQPSVLQLNVKINLTLNNQESPGPEEVAVLRDTVALGGRREGRMRKEGAGECGDSRYVSASETSDLNGPAEFSIGNCLADRVIAQGRQQFPIN